MDIKEYHSHPALSFSSLSVLLKNAKKFKKMIDGEYQLEGKNLDIGSAFHSLVLEPEKFAKEFVIAPEMNRRTKEGKQKWEEFLKESEEKTVLTSDDFKLVFSLKEKVEKLKNFSKWLEAGEVEKSFFAKIDGIEIKCRPDLLVKTKKGYIVVDLKTSSSEATPENFAKASANFLYYMQEAIYREVLQRNGINVISFLFAYVSKTEHSDAIYCEHDYIAREEGDTLFLKALEKYKYCLNNNIWSEGRFDFQEKRFYEINQISLPNYAFYQFL